MRKVRILPREICEKIAAGEVVERPASIVKELVENSLDAEATAIILEIQGGGAELIKVSDNGTGMSREDLLCAIQRHATSKIGAFDDLCSLHSYGFRGEALPSIAAVSTVKIVTKDAESQTGTSVIITGGEVTDIREAAAERGTTISVSDLFYNTPARKKFLKSRQTEEGKIVQSLLYLTLPNYKTTVRLSKEKRDLLFAPPHASLLERILALFPHLPPDQLLEIREEAGPRALQGKGYSLTGYVTAPGFYRSNRSTQFFFVNGRWIKPGALGVAVQEAYRGFLQSQEFPAYFLFLEIDPGLLDVNVSPTKSEVRFASPHELFEFVKKGVAETLQASVTPMITVIEQPGDTERWLFNELRSASPEGKKWFSFPPGLQTPPDRLEASGAPHLYSQPLEEHNPAPPAMESHPLYLPSETSEEAVEFLGEISRTYGIFRVRDLLYLVDSHNAHERVNYDRLVSHLQDNHDPSHQPAQMLFPFPVSLSPFHMQLARRYQEILFQVGVTIEPFGDYSFLLRAVPAGFEKLSGRELFLGLLEDLAAYEERYPSKVKERALATMACKISVKAGESLTRQEHLSLFHALSRSSNPRTCPHGRPILITLSLDDLHRLFKRK